MVAKSDKLYKVDRSAREFTFENGDTIMMPRVNAALEEKPIHVDVTANIPSTPGYFRILSPILAGRYVAGSLSNAIWNIWGKDRGDDANWLQKALHEGTETGITPFDWLTQKLSVNNELQPFKDLANALANNESASNIESLKQKVEGRLKRINHRGAQLEKDIDAFMNAPDQTVTLRGTVNGMVDSQNSTNIPDGVVQRANQDFPIEQTIKGKDDYLKDYKKQFEKLGDESLRESLTGMLSIGVTGYYAMRVSEGIYKTFAETVAYELGQNPEQTTLLDFFRSENKIVKKTLDNFIKKNTARLGTDALFFGRQLGNIPGLDGLKSQGWLGVGLFAKASLLAIETQRPHTSIFDDLQNLIDRRLNPQQGLGDQMRPTNLIDLYQKYHIDEPEKQLLDVTFHGASDAGEWRKTDAIFARAADWMNNTYVYKHSTQQKQDPEEALIQDALNMMHYFTLPKYIFLLGHDMIDHKKPEESLALIEISARYSVQEAKEVHQRLQNGEELIDLLRTRPVDMEHAFQGVPVSKEFAEISRMAREVDRSDALDYIMNHPDYREEYERIQQAKREAAETPEAASLTNILSDGPLAEKPREKAVSPPDRRNVGEPPVSFFPANAASLARPSNDSAPQNEVHDARHLASSVSNARSSGNERE